MFIDPQRCIGCRACQVACKHWNDRDGEETEFLGESLGFQNPAVLSAQTLTLISFHESVDESSPGGLRSDYVMRRCLHCIEPACVSACPTPGSSRTGGTRSSPRRGSTPPALPAESGRPRRSPADARRRSRPARSP